MLEEERRVMRAAVAVVDAWEDLTISGPHSGVGHRRYSDAMALLVVARQALPDGYKPPGDIEMVAGHDVSLEEMTRALGGTMHTVEIPDAQPMDNRE